MTEVEAQRTRVDGPDTDRDPSARPSGPARSRPLDPPPGNVAVFRALQLGDLLCAVPALRALRRGLPEARITLVGLPWAEVLVERFPAYLDAFVPFPGHPALPERTPDHDAWDPFVARMHAERFDLLLQMHGDGSVSNGIAGGLGAAVVAGFAPDTRTARDRAGGPDQGRFLRYPDEGHEIRRLLALVRALGMPDAGEALEFPVTPADRADLAALIDPVLLATARPVVVHPGARAGERRWPPERFAAVADALAADGHPIVVTGTEAERATTEAVRDAMAAPVIDLTGRTGLGALAALLAAAALLVSNDTGVAHLAAAVRTRSVVVFSASDPARWAPLDRSRHAVVRAADPGAAEQVLAAARTHVTGEARRVA